MRIKSVLVPLCSRFNKVKISELVNYHAELLKDQQIKFLKPMKSINEIEDYANFFQSADVILALACTGGVSRLIIKLSEFNKPLIILSHPKQNSLASAIHASIIIKSKNRLTILHHNLSKQNLSEFTKKLELAKVLADLSKKKVLLIIPSEEWLLEENYNLDELKRVFGIDVELFRLNEFIKIYEKADVDQELVKKFSESKKIGVNEEELERSAKVFSAIRSLLINRNAFAYGIRCFPFILSTGVTPCIAISHSIDNGIIGACEADLGALITMLLAFAITKQPVFMGNIEDSNGNQIVLAHCTIATSLVKNYYLLPHFETNRSVSIRGILTTNEEITLLRLSNNFKKLFLATGRIIKGEAWSDEFCRTQIMIKLNRDAAALIENPISSHLIMIKGDWSKEFNLLSKILGISVI